MYELDERRRLVKAAQRKESDDPFVDLDPAYYKLVPGFEQRFPVGAPSLVGSERLTVRGDITFGAGVVVLGSVEIDDASGGHIDDGAVLQG